MSWKNISLWSSQIATFGGPGHWLKCYSSERNYTVYRIYVPLISVCIEISMNSHTISAHTIGILESSSVRNGLSQTLFAFLLICCLKRTSRSELTLRTLCYEHRLWKRRGKAHVTLTTHFGICEEPFPWKSSDRNTVDAKCVWVWVSVCVWTNCVRNNRCVFASNENSRQCRNSA